MFYLLYYLYSSSYTSFTTLPKKNVWMYVVVVSKLSCFSFNTGHRWSRIRIKKKNQYRIWKYNISDLKVMTTQAYTIFQTVSSKNILFQRSSRKMYDKFLEKSIQITKQILWTRYNTHCQKSGLSIYEKILRSIADFFFYFK